jgi:hypothetical protein
MSASIRRPHHDFRGFVFGFGLLFDFLPGCLRISSPTFNESELFVEILQVFLADALRLWISDEG